MKNNWFRMFVIGLCLLAAPATWAFPYGNNGPSWCDHCWNATWLDDDFVGDYGYVDIGQTNDVRYIGLPAALDEITITLGNCSFSYTGVFYQFQNRGEGDFTVIADYWDTPVNTIEGDPTFSVPPGRDIYELMCHWYGPNGETGFGQWEWSVL